LTTLKIAANAVSPYYLHYVYLAIVGNRLRIVRMLIANRALLYGNLFFFVGPRVQCLQFLAVMLRIFARGSGAFLLYSMRVDRCTRAHPFRQLARLRLRAAKVTRAFGGLPVLGLG
jgi:hypothetical protein